MLKSYFLDYFLAGCCDQLGSNTVQDTLTFIYYFNSEIWAQGRR